MTEVSMLTETYASQSTASSQVTNEGNCEDERKELLPLCTNSVLPFSSEEAALDWPEKVMKARRSRAGLDWKSRKMAPPLSAMHSVKVVDLWSGWLQSSE